MTRGWNSKSGWVCLDIMFVCSYSMWTPFSYWVLSMPCIPIYAHPSLRNKSFLFLTQKTIVWIYTLSVNRLYIMVSDRILTPGQILPAGHFGGRSSWGKHLCALTPVSKVNHFRDFQCTALYQTVNGIGILFSRKCEAKDSLCLHHRCWLSWQQYSSTHGRMMLRAN